MPRRATIRDRRQFGCRAAVLLAMAAGATFAPLGHACTIGVAAGRATSDGRPLLWKVRDQGEYPDNQVIWNDNPANPHHFIAVANAGDTLAWMGVNEAGFAIVNSNSLDLVARADFGNGSLMHHALGHCATVAEFSRLLDSTSTSGMRDVHSNYGVIDATGAAWMFEVEDSLFWRYDADEEAEVVDGVIIRTNFSMAGGGANGMARYLRSVALIGEFCAGDSLNYRSLLTYHARDFSDANSEPIPVPYPGQWNQNVPYGYFWTHLSICREGSVSGVVFRGVEPGQMAWQTTMWSLLGQPASAIAVPAWPVGSPPSALAGAPTAPLCDTANLIRALLFDCAYDDYLDSFKLRTETGRGLWGLVFPVEQSLFDAADQLDASWRLRRSSVTNPAAASSMLAEQALLCLENAYDALGAAEPVDDLCAEHTDGGMVITWEPVTRSVAGTPLVATEYALECAKTPSPSSGGEIRTATTEPRCVIPVAHLGGFFCRVTARTRTAFPVGPWVWVYPLGE